MSIITIRALTPEEIRSQMPELDKWRLDAVIDLQDGLRDKINVVIGELEEPKRTIIRHKFASAQRFVRNDELFDLLAAHPSIGKTLDDIDVMWGQGLSF